MANCVYVMANGKNVAFYSPSLAIAGKHEKRHAMRTCKLQAVF